MTLLSLIKRNIKLFFKDKGLVIGALVGPIILIVLYFTFLNDVYRDTFKSFIPEGTSNKIINDIVNGELISSILAVSCITVSFCSNFLMVRDKVNNARSDLLVSPVKSYVLALAYYIATVISSLTICYIALGISLVFVAFSHWFFTASSLLMLLLDVFLTVLFGTALSSIINFFLTSEGQISAVGTIISAGYGFICGAYMPINSYNFGLKNVIMFTPGTYCTSLIRNHSLAGAFKEMSDWPIEAIKSIKDGIDCNLYLFDKQISIAGMYGIVLITILVLITIYIVINIVNGRKCKTR
ncbi:MAG TPA: ABC transporter [Firmicutes bacterium]|nr:ABC transporter [Bacillota bacterium]HAW99866.1 ABC transporter [Bacillota bacterium]